MAKLLLGKEVTDALNANLQTRTAALREKGIVPTLGIIRVGADPSDLSYEKGATKRAELVGVDVKKFELPADATKEDVLSVIDQVNADDSIHGVLMFRPLPKHLKADQNEICNRLAPQKDVDCMTHLSNAGVFEGLNDLGFAPCTPSACMEILDYYGIDCKGKNAVSSPKRTIPSSMFFSSFISSLSVSSKACSKSSTLNTLFSFCTTFEARIPERRRIVAKG